MTKGRLEAFSDGVIAIIITIMVLELKIPHQADAQALISMTPIFLCYIMSFAILGIYWNNHHHLLQAARRVSGGVLWANMHLLFWLSLVPFTTGWMGENGFAPLPVAVYGVVLLLAGVAYYILAQTLVALHGKDSALAVALGRDWKGKISVVAYLIAVFVAFVNSWVAWGIYVAVTAMWLVPDRRIEKTLQEE